MLVLRGVRIDLALQPEAEPVEVSLIGREFLSGFDLDMRGIGEDVRFTDPRHCEPANQFDRQPRFLFRELHQDRSVNAIDIEGWGKSLPQLGGLVRGYRTPCLAN